MNFNFLNPPVLSSLQSRKNRAKRAIEILRSRETKSSSSRDNRWKVWIQMHKDISESLDVESMLIFQSHPVLGPSITGGSGRHFLSMIAERYGQQRLELFLRNHTETLCGQPKDLVTEQGSYITVTSMRHLYHLARIHEICHNCFNSSLNFFEIGGGFGNLARQVLQYGLCGQYYIVDHPAMHAVQYFFLSEFLPESEIAVTSENGKYITGSPDSKIQLYSSFNFADSLKAKTQKPFMLVSTMALTEIPTEYQNDYLDYFSPDLIYIFGQLQNLTLGGGKSAAGACFSNEALVFSLGEKFHTIDYKFHGYHFEYIGRKKSGALARKKES